MQRLEELEAVRQQHGDPIPAAHAELVEHARETPRAVVELRIGAHDVVKPERDGVGAQAGVGDQSGIHGGP